MEPLDLLIRRVNTCSTLPQVHNGELDPRWQAVIDVADYLEVEPILIWREVKRWGCNRDEDFTSAIATCLLEHLLEHNLIEVFAEVEKLALTDACFADTFARCWKFGSSESPENVRRFDNLKRRVCAVRDAPR